MYNFINANFTPNQQRRFKTLAFVYNFAGWIAVASIILPFVYETLAYFFMGIAHIDISLDIPYLRVILFALVMRFVLRKLVANRCVNCLRSNALEEQSEKIMENELLILNVAKQMKCKKCGFECEQLIQRTGSYEGIGRMSRTITQGGKSRQKGESYISWWRRNK